MNYIVKFRTGNTTPNKHGLKDPLRNISLVTLHYEAILSGTKSNFCKASESLWNITKFTSKVFLKIFCNLYNSISRINKTQRMEKDKCFFLHRENDLVEASFKLSASLLSK